MAGPTADAALDRAAGALVGLAVGDALGAAVEGLPRGSFAPLTDFAGGGPLAVAPGQWTDDTALALCLAESLLAAAELDEHDLMHRFHRWQIEGENSSAGPGFGIGRTTWGALDRFARSGDPHAGRAEDPPSNGGLMRLAPVATRWWHAPARAEALARRQCATTHGAAEALDACALLCRVLCAAIAGAWPTALAATANPAWTQSVQRLAHGAWRDLPADAVGAAGEALATLEAAFWCVERTKSFAEAVLTAANLGGDADTIAAVAGQIAGAAYGLAAIPEHWRARLHEQARIQMLARRLATSSGRPLYTGQGKQ
jgi:ADP-ribosyl-[dinitrogen reductase] hydrolase